MKAVLGEEPIYFVEDNCPIHESQILSKWFEDHPQIIKVRWPPRRPDLNIIEHVWAIMTQEWNQQNERTAKHLEEHVLRSWESMRRTPHILHKLAESMPTRIQAVKDNNGGYTKY